MSVVAVDTDRDSVQARVRRTAVLLRAKWPLQSIAWELGVTVRSVERYRADARAQGLLSAQQKAGRCA